MCAPPFSSGSVHRRVDHGRVSLHLPPPSLPSLLTNHIYLHDGISSFLKVEEDAGGPNFQASSKFSGRKVGFEFKKGAKGVGYYRTNPTGGGGGSAAAEEDDGVQVEQQEVPDAVFGDLSKMEGFAGRANRKKKK